MAFGDALYCNWKACVQTDVSPPPPVDLVLLRSRVSPRRSQLLSCLIQAPWLHRTPSRISTWTSEVSELLPFGLFQWPSTVILRTESRGPALPKGCCLKRWPVRPILRDASAGGGFLGLAARFGCGIWAGSGGFGQAGEGLVNLSVCLYIHIYIYVCTCTCVADTDTRYHKGENRNTTA